MIQIELTKLAKKQLLKAPKHIQLKLNIWRTTVLLQGLEATRNEKGYHDEPLQGKRQCQRSIRLNRQWRAIYSTHDNGTLTLLTIEEVTPHDYRTR
jgi:proteic killer suppression protein